MCQVTRAFLAALITVFFLAGCVSSVEPIGVSNGPQTDVRLVGAWKVVWMADDAPSGWATRGWDSAGYLMMLPGSEGHLNGMFARWSPAADEKSAQVAGTIVVGKTAGYSLLNISVGWAGEEERPDDAEDSYDPLLYRIDADGSLELFALDESAVEKAIDSNRIKGTPNGKGGEILTDDPPHLDKFVGETAPTLFTVHVATLQPIYRPPAEALVPIEALRNSLGTIGVLSVRAGPKLSFDRNEARIGADGAITDTTARSIERKFGDLLAASNVPARLRERILVRAPSAEHFVDAGNERANGGATAADYDALARAGVQTVLEVGRVWVEPTCRACSVPFPQPTQNPIADPMLGLSIHVSARLIHAADERVIWVRDVAMMGREERYSEWIARDGHDLLASFEDRDIDFWAHGIVHAIFDEPAPRQEPNQN